MTLLQEPHPATDPAPARPRVLIAPVTVTPTKPLSPSHVKGLLWTDVMVRATEAVADVGYRYSPTTYHPCEQTLGFWVWLDRNVGDEDWSGATEADVGELYVRAKAAERIPFADCVPYLAAIEESGWVHPASARILELWAGHYRRLGLRDPGLTRHQPPAFTLEQAIDRLRAEELCLDQRDQGGPVYLDATRDGLPLRAIVAPDGRPNYLACALRELVPLAMLHDEVVLLYDRELEPDYLLLQRVLERFGPAVHRVGLGRVPVDGAITSAREGVRADSSLAGLLDDLGTEHSDAALRLGMRLYFVAMLGPGDAEEFRRDLLDRRLRRTPALLDGPADGEPSGPEALAAALERHRRGHAYVDPYSLTSGLLGKHPRGPVHELLQEVYT